MATVLPFPRRRSAPMEFDLAEIATAVTLVAAGVAQRVRLVNLRRPLVAAGIAAAQAGEAGLEFRVDRSGGRAQLVIGPRK